MAKRIFKASQVLNHNIVKDPFVQNLSEKLQKNLQYSFGYPTRRAFAESITEEELNKIREEYSISKDENVILVMMGGNTAQAAKLYGSLLLNMSQKQIEQIIGKDNKRNKIRLICLCGDISQKQNRLALSMVCRQELRVIYLS